MRVRIGNQTAFFAAPLTAPFDYAVENGFDAFEWFPDKKGPGEGWDENDIPGELRRQIRSAALDHGIRLSVHAPWPSNPLEQERADSFGPAVRFAEEIGAVLFNVHFHADKGIDAYVGAIMPLVHCLAKEGIILSIENTPEIAPEDFNMLFSLLHKKGLSDPSVTGICLDLGHANICSRTKNDYLGYVDLLSPDVPIVHVHLHENYGDADTHLPVFTGPSASNDAGIRGFVERLKKRNFSGSIILEQWPNPPALLNKARNRLIEMFGSVPDPADRPLISGDDFAAEIADADSRHGSWRKKLDWIREVLESATRRITDETLAYLAVYLRFVGTGQVPTGEDGGHYRPSNHARISRRIYEMLAKIENPENAFILRKIYPWLPSFDTPFIHAEPLTRIRDIAHRNDIPRELKDEIKHTLQNKLHRSAGPGDLVTAAALFERITAPGASYPPAFVEEFAKFHEELKEFFNARSLDEQLSAIARKHDAELIREFAATKEDASTVQEMLYLFSLLTELRARFGKGLRAEAGAEALELMSTDIMLEDYSFALLSSMVDSFSKAWRPADWEDALLCLRMMAANLRLSGFDGKECSAIENELVSWSKDLDTRSNEKLLRLKATIERSLRLAEVYAARILRLFPEKAERLGRLLGVAEHAVRLFSEADIRAHPVFQLSKLASFLLKKIRGLAGLPAWDIIVPGKAAGSLTAADVLSVLPPAQGPLLALVSRVEGDEEVPPAVHGLISSEETPRLSHLAVRARQRGVPFAVCGDEEIIADLRGCIGKNMIIEASDDKVSFLESTAEEDEQNYAAPDATVFPEVSLAPRKSLLFPENVTPATGGGKAYGARRLEELGKAGQAGFLSPKAVVIPFGVLDEALTSRPDLLREYTGLSRKLDGLSGAEYESALEKLRGLILSLSVPDEVMARLNGEFRGRGRLMVRSSSNLEDLEGMSGAGLYESVSNVSLRDAADAVKKVWASLWTRRAAMSRKMYRIPHEKAHMAVLIQRMIAPDYSFIMHTVNPSNRDPGEIYIEMAVGLGETLASARVPGLPYRITCDRGSSKVKTLAFASFSHALFPDRQGTKEETVDYSKTELSTDAALRERLAARLGRIGEFIETSFGMPQDVEGVVAGGAIYLVQSRPQQGV